MIFWIGFILAFISYGFTWMTKLYEDNEVAYLFSTGAIFHPHWVRLLLYILYPIGLGLICFSSNYYITNLIIIAFLHLLLFPVIWRLLHDPTKP